MSEADKPETSTHPTDWSFGNRHDILISNRTKEEKLAVYASWADTYCEDITNEKYSAPETISSKLFSLTTAPKISVLDVACGSGLLAPPLIRIAEEKGITLNFVGLDYSTEMLAFSKKYGFYNSLVQADLNDPLPIAEGSFDFIIAGGLFTAGHCGPQVIPNMAKCLAVDGFALFTIRCKTYDDAKDSYQDEFAKGGLHIVEETVSHYLGPGDCYYVVLKRTH